MSTVLCIIIIAMMAGFADSRPLIGYEHLIGINFPSVYNL
jgi:hypothetical protein